jgi:hypothetical protein
MKELGELFAVRVLAFSAMSNHLHLALQFDPEWVEAGTRPALTPKMAPSPKKAADWGLRRGKRPCVSFCFLAASRGRWSAG